VGIREDLEKKHGPIDSDRVNRLVDKLEAEIRAYRLKELRKELNITQVELAQLLHVSQNRISRIEHGDIEKSQVGDRKFQLA
jgi:DNA-binding XRE family transcriptional regulator